MSSTDYITQTKDTYCWKNKRGRCLASRSFLSCYITLLQIKMAPQGRRQRTGTLNYQQQRDCAAKEKPDSRLWSGEARVAGGLGSGEARVEGWLGSGESKVEGELGSGEARVEGGLGSGEAGVEGRLGSEEARVEGGLGRSICDDGEEMPKKTTQALRN